MCAQQLPLGERAAQGLAPLGRGLYPKTGLIGQGQQITIACDQAIRIGDDCQIDEDLIIRITTPWPVRLAGRQGDRLRIGQELRQQFRDRVAAQPELGVGEHAQQFVTVAVQTSGVTVPSCQAVRSQVKRPCRNKRAETSALVSRTRRGTEDTPLTGPCEPRQPQRRRRAQ